MHTQASAYIPPPISLEPRPPQQSRRSRPWSGLVISFTVHAAIVFAGWRYVESDRSRIPSQTVIAAKLVQVGTPRDEKLLPRLPAPVQAEPTVIATAVDGSAAPSASSLTTTDNDAKALKANEALERQKKLMEALAKLQPTAGATASKPQETEGREDGSPMGDAQQAEEGDIYAAAVVKSLKDNFVVPTTISPQERTSLFCELLIFVAADGSVMRYELQTSSGNPHFDRAVEATLQRARFPIPPESLRRVYADDGLPVRFKP